jgi:hypothetical protein
MRVPLGFVVEGVCEYQSFQSFVRKGVSAGHGLLPIANAWGNGGLRKRLEEHLIEVIKVNHPYVIIVALDLKDALAEGKHTDCAQLRVELQARVDAWLKQTGEGGKLAPLPDRIVVVIQAPVFEAWLTADPAGLHAKSGKKYQGPEYNDVDTEIKDHVHWLSQRVSGGYSKSAGRVHPVAKSLNPHVMAQSSRSFRKFWKEVLAAYATWAEGTGQPFVVNGT